MDFIYNLGGFNLELYIVTTKASRNVITHCDVIKLDSIFYMNTVMLLSIFYFLCIFYHVTWL